MFKTFFMAKSAAPEVDAELERTMQLLRDRMEKLMQEEIIRRQRFSTVQSAPAGYVETWGVRMPVNSPISQL
jgi:hypothetical protein